MTDPDDRARDAHLHELLYGVPIEWRDCWREPAYGEWEEVQSQDELLAQELGPVPIGDNTTKQPCYNPLDAPDLRPQTLTDADVATLERDAYWRVVPFYGSDWRAAGAVLEQFGARHSPSLYQIGRWYCNFLIDGQRIEAPGLTGPRAVREAAIRALSGQSE